MAAQQQTEVLADLGLNWLQCRDAQGIFFFNQETQQSRDTYPVELQGGQDPYQQAQYQVQGAPPVYQYQAGLPPVQVTGGSQLADFQQTGLHTVEKLRLGNWVICEDDQGEFYHDTMTGQSYDAPPQDLVVLYQQYTAQQGDEAQAQLQPRSAPGMQTMQQGQQYVVQQPYAGGSQYAQPQVAMMQQVQQAQAYQVQAAQPLAKAVPEFAQTATQHYTHQQQAPPPGVQQMRPAVVYQQQQQAYMQGLQAQPQSQPQPQVQAKAPSPSIYQFAAGGVPGYVGSQQAVYQQTPYQQPVPQHLAAAQYAAMASQHQSMAPQHQAMPQQVVQLQSQQR